MTLEGRVEQSPLSITSSGQWPDFDSRTRRRLHKTCFPSCFPFSGKFTLRAAFRVTKLEWIFSEMMGQEKQSSLAATAKSPFLKEVVPSLSSSLYRLIQKLINFGRIAFIAYFPSRG